MYSSYVEYEYGSNDKMSHTFLGYKTVDPTTCRAHYIWGHRSVKPHFDRAALRLGHSKEGFASLPNLPPGRSGSRRTSRGWGPAVRGEQPGDCAGKVGARTASNASA